MSSRLSDALDAAYKAGRLTLRYFQTGTAVDLKADDTPVTAADREAESLIRGEIARCYPGESVLGEEQGLTGAGDDRWVIDPIDGTKSFVAGVPLYAVLLSYEVAGNPEVGVCYFPALDEMFYAEKGSGAFRNGRSIRVSERRAIKGGTIVCGSIHNFARQGRLDSLMAACNDAQALRTWGDAYGHSLVASGQADAMLDPIVNRWDISAMCLIVREAGGRFTDFRGNDALSNEAISANPFIHGTLVKAFPP